MFKFFVIILIDLSVNHEVSITEKFLPVNMMIPGGLLPQKMALTYSDDYT
jgi:hypothetical protein